VFLVILAADMFLHVVTVLTLASCEGNCKTERDGGEDQTSKGSSGEARA